MAEISETEITPAERRRNKVRQTILEAAERVFAEDGEAGLSIRRLADTIDYSPGAIYKYFQSKQELVDELKESFFARILEQVEEVPADRGQFLAYARYCIETYVRTALERPHHYAAAFSGEAQPNPEVRCEPLSNRERAFGVLREMVVRGIAQGAFRAGLDPHLASKSLWASAHGLAVLMSHLPNLAGAFLGSDVATADELIAAHADNSIRGLM